MKNFKYLGAESFEEAGNIKKDNAAAVMMAGGTDLLGVWKDGILSEYPEQVVDLKRIPGGDGIMTDGKQLKIGALSRLSEIAESQIVKGTVPGLAEAAHSVATPQIRNAGTIGGNLCQDVRCWFYRYPHDGGGRLECMRKGGEQCYAIQGDNRYHSIFGGMKAGAGECTKHCPAGTDVSAYMEKLREGDWDGAASIILEANPMPMLTSRICPHPCQDFCNQCKHGDSVNIHGVERSVGDHILANRDRFYTAPEMESGKKAAVIGAGPGGLSAAYYLRKAGHQVTVYDKMEKAGGVLQYGIPHYRLPKTYVDQFVEALAGMGITFKLGVDVGKDITMEEIRKQNDTVYIGTGAWKQPVLGIEGENLTEFGLDFLVEVNTFLRKAIGRNVVVCGGGNVAMVVALTACRLGAENVQLVCLEKREDMPASREEIERALEEGVSIYNGWGLAGVVTGEGGKVSGLEAKRCVSVFDEKGHFAPSYDETEKQVFEAECIILATGQRVDLDFLGDSLKSQLADNRGRLAADEASYGTRMEGVFAGGDAVTGPNIAIRAINAGRAASVSMNRFMGNNPEPKTKKTGFLHYDVDGVTRTAANKLMERPVAERSLTDEDSVSFDTETACREASRCMNCGCYSVSPSDLAPMLIALGADLVTTDRTVSAEEFFTGNLKICDNLHPGELIKEILVPYQKGNVTHYDKFRLRDSVDFSIVSLGSVFAVDSGCIRKASLVFGGVAPVPYRAVAAEKYLAGREINEETASEAAKLAVKDATPLSGNAYKVIEMETMLKEAILRAGR